MLKLIVSFLWHVCVACTDMQLILPTVVYYVQSTIFFTSVLTVSTLLHLCYPTSMLQITETASLSTGVVVVDPGSIANVFRFLASLPSRSAFHTRLLVPETDCEDLIKFLFVVLSGGFIVRKNTTKLNTIQNHLRYYHAKNHASCGLLVCCKTSKLQEHLKQTIGTEHVVHLKIKDCVTKDACISWNMAQIDEIFSTIEARVD